MKRLFCVLLILCLVLTSCAMPLVPLSVNGGTAGNSTESSAAEDGGQGTAAPETEPPQADTYNNIKALDSGENETLNAVAQEQEKFKLVSTTPAKRASGATTNVALDTGIEFVFNQANVDISKDFSITPQTPGRFLTFENRSVFVPESGLAPTTTYTVKLSGKLKAPDGSELGSDFEMTFTTLTPETDTSKDAHKALAIEIAYSADETFLTTDPVILALYIYNGKKNQEFLVEAFALSEQQYLKELYERNLWIYDSDVKEKKPALISGRKAAYSMNTAVMPGLRRGEYSSSINGVAFPKPFSAGYYVVQISGTDAITGKTVWDQKLVQVNDMVSYALSSDGGAVLWINDAKSGSPVSGRTAEVVDVKTGTVIMKGKTDNSGVAQVKYENNLSKWVSTALLHVESAKSGEPDYWEIINLRERAGKTVYQQYMFYMRTDRSIYHPTDKVNIWGVVRGRSGALAAGSSFALKLSDYNSTLKTIPVTLAADGSFIAEISIKDYASDGYNISLVEASGDRRDLTQSYFYVEDFVKPEYVVSAFTDKEFYMPGESVKAGVRATFFDGTPVAGMRFYSSRNDKWVYTNENGEATDTIPYKAGDARQYSWEPYEKDFYFENGETGNGASGSAVYFPSALIFQAGMNYSAAKPSIHVKTNHLDTSRIKSGADIFKNSPSAFLGAAANTNVKVTIKKETHTPVSEKKSVYYDWITKKQQTSVWYEYAWVEKTLSSYSANTKNGELVISDFPVEVFNNTDEKNWHYYYAELSAFDKNGRELRETVYLCERYFAPLEDEDAFDEYYFTRENYMDASGVMGGGYDYGSYAKLGEDVSMRLVSNGNVSGGRILYMLATDKIIDYKVTAKHNFSFDFSKKYLPRMTVLGAYFDGKHIYAVRESDLYYDSTGQELDIEVKASPAEAKPGETVKLEVDIRDKNGKPVQSVFNLSVVDEALLAISGNTQSNPIRSFYHWGRWLYYSTTVSYHQYKTSSKYEEYAEDEDAEYEADDDDVPDAPDGYPNHGGGDGGGDVYTRKEFLDTAQFASGTTDAKGKATVSFKMPDNITSWNAGIVAVAKDSVMAGEFSMSLVVTQPMFVQVTAGDSYLTSEDVGVALRARGAKILSDTPVSYHVEIRTKDGAVVKTQDKTNPAAKKLELNFGRMGEGSYILSVTGRAKDSADKIELPFTVGKKSTLITMVSRQISLTGDNTKLDINPARYPVVIGFGDSRYSTYMQAASRILYGRLDMAQDIPTSLIAAEFIKKNSDGNDVDFSYLPTNIGDYLVPSYGGGLGIAQTSYDEADERLTAMTLMLMGDKVPQKKKIAAYLRAVADDDGYISGDGEATALMGLAAMGEPVLDKVQNSVKAYEKAGTAPEITVWSYLCTSLSLLGDSAGAKQIFDKRIAPYIKEGVITLQSKDDVSVYRVYYDTASALVAASAVNSSKAKSLAQYLLDNDSRYFSANLELAWFIKKFNEPKTGEAKFQYRKDGTLHTETLDKYGLRYISFTKKDLENPEFRVLSGKVDATVTYSADLEEASRHVPERSRSLVSIDKVMRPAVAADFPKNSSGPPPDAETLKNSYTIVYTVRLKPGAQSGYYNISDRIPSSLRYSNSDDKFTVAGTEFAEYTSYHIEKQNLNFSFGFEGNYETSSWVKDSQGNDVAVRKEFVGEGVMEIRVVCQKLYTATWDSDKALLQHEGSGLLWLSNK